MAVIRGQRWQNTPDLCSRQQGAQLFRVPSSSEQGASDGQTWDQRPWNPTVTLAWPLKAAYYLQEAGGLHS